MISPRMNLPTTGRVTRSLSSSQPGHTEHATMDESTADFQAFVRQSLTLLNTVLAELKSVKESVDSLTRDGLEMRTSLNALTDDLRDMKTTLEEHKKEVLTLRAEINTITKRSESLTSQNSDLKEENLKLQTYMRRQNLIIEGLHESENEDVQQKVITHLADLCKIVLNPCDIDKVHRYGRSVAGKPRPIIIRFISHSSRDRVLLGYRSIKDKPKNLFVNEDLPYDIKTRRADIRAVATQARSTGAKVKLQGDRVVIDSKVYKLSTH